MGKTVSYAIDHIPPITPEERKELLRLSEAYEGEIDVSDIPPIPPEVLKRAVRGRFYRPVKQQVTLRIDANVLDWFKRNTPKGYQTDINRVLSDYVARQEKEPG